jgi:hypothetical protein
MCHVVEVPVVPTALVTSSPNERGFEMSIALKSAGFDVVIADAESGAVPGSSASISCYIQMPPESPPHPQVALASARGAVSQSLLARVDVIARVAPLLTPEARVVLVAAPAVPGPPAPDPGLLRMLIMAVLGDYGRDRVRVAVVDESHTPGDIVAFARSEAPSWADYAAMAPNLAYADWRHEVISVKTAFDWGG